MVPTTLTSSVKSRAAAFGRTAAFSSAFADAIEERLEAVRAHLGDVVSVFGLKSVNGKHVAYAWKHASLGTPAKAAALNRKTGKAVVGGNPGTTLPSEYFGVESYSYYPLAEVQPLEAHVNPTADATRPAMPIKELVVVADKQYGGSGANFVTEELMHAWFSNNAISGGKPNKDALKAMTDLTNTFAAVLMAKSAAQNVATPVALIKFARTV